MKMGSVPQPMPMPAMPAAPSVPDPVRVPSPSDPDVMAARQQKMRDEFANRRGRDSTRLAPAQRGDVSYSRTTLG